MADPDDTLPLQIAALGYPNAERIAKMLEHSRAHMKALADLVGISPVEFKSSSLEWVARDQVMALVPELREHAAALTAMLREELLRGADGVMGTFNDQQEKP